jgi:hypothetical protein
LSGLYILAYRARHCKLVDLLGLRVGGDDDVNGLLSCGGASPTDCDLAADGEVELVCEVPQVELLCEFEFLFESFFLRLPNMLGFETGREMLRSVE